MYAYTHASLLTLALSLFSFLSLSHVSLSFDFSLSSLLFLISFYLSFSLFFLIYISQDKLTQFVDLGSITNVSTVALDSRLHGYYIHGRSPHGFADVDMATLSSNLQKVRDRARNVHVLPCARFCFVLQMRGERSCGVGAVTCGSGGERQRISLYGESSKFVSRLLVYICAMIAGLVSERATSTVHHADRAPSMCPPFYALILLYLVRCLCGTGWYRYYL